MSRRGRIAFIAVVVAQLVFPLGMIGYNELKLASGTEVRLQVQPVDPTDFFRGEYVALNYAISRVDVEGDPPPGTTVYVPLHKAGNRWTGSFATLERPPDGTTFIRGHTQELGGMTFGIESYYVEQGKARRYEQAMTTGALFADVVLDDEGGAKIKRLRIIPQD